MKRFLLFCAVLLLAGRLAHADEVLVPVATPTPDTDAVAYYTWSRIVYAQQVRKTDGTDWQNPRVDVTYVALRSDGFCSRQGGTGECRTFNASYYGATAIGFLQGLNSANFSGSNPSFSKQVMLFGQSNGIIPAGSVAGTPGITVYNTPTPLPTQAP